MAVSLSSDDTAITVPASVTVVEGATTASFDLVTRAASGLKVFSTASLGPNTIRAMVILQSGPGATETYVNLLSLPGDPLGQGRSGGYSTTTAAFSAVNSCHGAALKVQVAAADGRRFVAVLAAPRGSTLGLSTYRGAQLYPNQDADRPALWAEWERRTCSQIFDGWFSIEDLLLGDGGAIRRLRATIAFKCNNSSPSAGEFRAFLNIRDQPVNTTRHGARSAAFASCVRVVGSDPHRPGMRQVS